MKKTEWLIIIATAAYSYLFYDQSAGINFLIFSILLTAFSLYRNTQLVREPVWLVIAAGTLLSGFTVFYYGNWLSLYANLLSVLLLAAYSVNTRTSLFIALFNSYFSLLAAVPSAAKNFHIPGKERADDGITRLKRVILIGMAVFVALIFFFLYRASNPVFEKVTDQIDLDFVSWGLIFFTLLGFLLMCGFFYHKEIKIITEADEKSPDQLGIVSDEEHTRSYMAQFISLANELFTGKVLLFLLNILLLSANTIDIYYLFIIGSLPKGLTAAQYLHDGTNSLIVSILLAITILLFYFRGRLNFIEEGRALRMLAYAWIVQNIFMVATTAQRNYFYISDYGLTYKRIGVYFFLSLCIIGLVTTFIKVMQVKSNWFMFRKNSWVWYSILVLSSVINWDAIIANYNIRLINEKKAVIDYSYMNDLSYTAFPSLLKFYEDKKDSTSADPLFNGCSVVNRKYAVLKEDVEQQQWQSTCWMKMQTIKEVEQFKARRKDSF